MFEIDPNHTPEAKHQIVASESLKVSQGQQQRDIFESHRHRVFSVGYYMTASEVEAEDILTNTFVQAFSTQKQPDGPGVDRALVGELGKRFYLEPEPSARPDVDAALGSGAARRTDLEEALRELPALERLVFLFRDVEGYPTARVAALVELTEAEVQRTLLSARIRMRNVLAASRQRDETAQTKQVA